MTTLMELTEDGGLKLPTGGVLYPGGRVRMDRKQACMIPESVIETLGLELDDDAFSFDSEVLVWPAQATH